MAYLAAPVPTVPKPRTPGERPDRAAPWLFHGPGVPRPPNAVGAAVLFGRDGTLLQGVARNGDPAMVHPTASARAALAALRSAGFALGVVSNQPGAALGLIDRRQIGIVQARAEALLGPIDVWAVCPHGPHDGCSCRMPAPDLVTAACRALGLAPTRVTVIGCGDSVIAAALAAGARAIRVPDPMGPDHLPVAPCTLTACRAADDPEAAAELVLGL